MGILHDPTSGIEHPLLASQTVGRSRENGIRIDDPSVSAHHAIVAWTGLCWTLRDASSRNGTAVSSNGTPTGPYALPAGEEVALRRGAHIHLGHDRVLVLTDDAPPSASATDDAGHVVYGTGGLLGLPDLDNPEVAVVLDPRRNAWWCEQASERRAVRDGDHVSVDGRTWELSLPERLEPTQHRSDAPMLATLEVAFSVSLDEETVGVRITHGQLHWEVQPRSHHYTLLTLARARLQDAGLPEAEAGWVDREHLLRQLAISDNLLHTHLFRARREFERIGVHDATGLIERRSVAGQLRLGIGRLTVSSMEPDDS